MNNTKLMPAVCDSCLVVYETESYNQRLTVHLCDECIKEHLAEEE